MTATEFAELARKAAVRAMQKLADESVEYSITTMGGGESFSVTVNRRPESQIEERRKRKELGQRLY